MLFRKNLIFTKRNCENGFVFLRKRISVLVSILVNGVKQPDGTIISLTPKQVADILGHSTSQITEMYYVKKDTTLLNGLTDAFSI